MTYSTHIFLTLATVLLTKAPPAGDADQPDSPPPPVPDVVEPALQRLWGLVEDFRRQPVSPGRTHQFEQQLNEALRELGRGIVQHTYNHLEPADVQALAKH